MFCPYKQQGICILVEDKIGVTVLLYCYHKSGLVLSTPSSQFKGNSCVELCRFILVETSLYIGYNCILCHYVFEEWH